jgi:nicotinate-nucleotide pyrophosphorylase (carboxylating)
MKELKIRQIRPVLKSALDEDIKSGDLTTEHLMPAKLKIKAEVVLKESGVIAGLKIAEEVFKIVDKNIKFERRAEDGIFIKGQSKKGRVIALVSGDARAILRAERTALNFLSHLSGVATLTRQFVEKVAGTKVKITDTRKTAPNLRLLEKYAVRTGGGYNHRMGLYDGILIKDNHIKSVNKTPAECVRIIKKKSRRPVEVEVKKVSQFENTLGAGADIIMLDNMRLRDIDKAMKIKKEYQKREKKAPLIEVSGKVTLSKVRKIAACGVDFISIGALTHSNPSLDMSLKAI